MTEYFGKQFVIYETEEDGRTIKDDAEEKIVEVVEETSTSIWYHEVPIEENPLESMPIHTFEDKLFFGAITLYNDEDYEDEFYDEDYWEDDDED